jgi:hypothetical protein
LPFRRLHVFLIPHDGVLLPDAASAFLAYSLGRHARVFVPVPDEEPQAVAVPSMTRVGADARLCTGDHALSRRWSLAVWRHPAQVDGIAYGCRHDLPRVAVAVFDWAADALLADSVGPLTSPENEELLGKILDTYGFGLIE